MIEKNMNLLCKLFLLQFENKNETIQKNLSFNEKLVFFLNRFSIFFIFKIKSFNKICDKK